MTEQNNSELCGFFTSFEKNKNTTIPEIVKNVLVLMDYTKFTIGKLTDTDITNLEKSVPDLLVDLGIQQEDLSKYLGRFTKNPKKFKFLPGQKIVLLELVSFCNSTNWLSKTSNTQTVLKRKATSEESLDEKGKLV